MVSYAASKKKFFIGINTNAMKMDDRAISCMIDNNVSSVWVSLDGLKEDHERIRKGSQFSVVEHNIKKLVERRGQRKTPQVGVRLIISDQSDEEINDFVDYWLPVVDSVSISPCLSEDLKVIDPQRFFGKNPTVSKPFCFWPFYFMAILWDGRTTTCCHDISGRIDLGNANGQKVMDIWRGNPFRSVRSAMFRNQPFEHLPCRECACWQKELKGLSRVTEDGRQVSHSRLSKVYSR